MKSTLDNFALMQTEWEAWQAIVRELRSRQIEVNDQGNEPLVNALRVWGERLHALRAEQDPEVVARALAMALEGRP